MAIIEKTEIQKSILKVDGRMGGWEERVPLRTE